MGNSTKCCMILDPYAFMLDEIDWGDPDLWEDDFYDYSPYLGGKSENTSNLVKTCSSPKDHKFEKKLLAVHYYKECIYCGYSPDLDGSKKDFEKCHKDYLEWEEKNR